MAEAGFLAPFNTSPAGATAITIKDISVGQDYLLDLSTALVPYWRFTPTQDGWIRLDALLTTSAYADPYMEFYPVEGDAEIRNVVGADPAIPDYLIRVTSGVPLVFLVYGVGSLAQYQAGTVLPLNIKVRISDWAVEEETRTPQPDVVRSFGPATTSGFAYKKIYNQTLHTSRRVRSSLATNGFAALPAFNSYISSVMNYFQARDYETPAYFNEPNGTRFSGSPPENGSYAPPYSGSDTAPVGPSIPSSFANSFNITSMTTSSNEFGVHCFFHAAEYFDTTLNQTRYVGPLWNNKVFNYHSYAAANCPSWAVRFTDLVVQTISARTLPPSGKTEDGSAELTNVKIFLDCYPFTPYDQDPTGTAQISATGHVYVALAETYAGLTTTKTTLSGRGTKVATFDVSSTGWVDVPLNLVSAAVTKEQELNAAAGNTQAKGLVIYVEWDELTNPPTTPFRSRMYYPAPGLMLTIKTPDWVSTELITPTLYVPPIVDPPDEPDPVTTTSYQVRMYPIHN